MAKKTERVELTWPDKHRHLTTASASNVPSVNEDDVVLTPVRSIGVGDRRGVLIAGESLTALRALASEPVRAERYTGQVKLCYLDPPFNTGEDFDSYPDSLSTPAWLSMIRERLVATRPLLAPDGSIWLHLDDRTQHYGRCLLDEVFGSQAFVATVIWQKRSSRDNRKSFSSMHDYIHVYAPAGPVKWKHVRNPLPDDGAFANPDKDPRGPWRSTPMTAPAGHATPHQYYKIVSPSGVAHSPPPGRCWTYTREKFALLVAEGRVYWPRNGAGKPRLKRYQDEVGGLAPFTIWTTAEVGENAEAKRELLRLFPERVAFDTPKPERLLARIIHVATDPADLVLDYFLGSGTTAAVAHKLGRRWVGVEVNSATVEDVTLPRLTRVAAGMDGIGIESVCDVDQGGFDFLEAQESTSQARVAL